ncbi:hypothetical protein CCYA_CCYA13G3552 [Cyanidiococcus yangmingshanensis]|nr:hypothetical protein CCYA_CCYA13G3552 [Cyanidiococcus yangmingshanensis]
MVSAADVKVTTGATAAAATDAGRRQGSRRPPGRAGNLTRKHLRVESSAPGETAVTKHSTEDVSGRDPLRGTGVGTVERTDAEALGTGGALDSSGDDSNRIDAGAILSVIVPAIGMSTTSLKASEAMAEQGAATARACDRCESGPPHRSGYDGPAVDTHWANQVYISSSGSSSMSGSGELGEKTSDMREGAPSLETPPEEGQSCSNSSSSRDGPGITGSSSDLRPSGVLQPRAHENRSHVRHPIVGPAVLLLCDACGAMPAVVYCTGQTCCYCERCAKRAHSAEVAQAVQQDMLTDWRARTAETVQAGFAEKKAAGDGNADAVYPSNRSRCGDSGDSGSGERDPTSESPSGGDQGTSNSGNGGSGDPTSSSPVETASAVDQNTVQSTKINVETAHRGSTSLPGRNLPRSVAMMMLLACSGEQRSSGSEDISAEGGEFASAESVSEDADLESTSFGHESARSGEFREEHSVYPAPTGSGANAKWTTALSDEDLVAAAEKAVRELASANGNGSRSADSRHASSNDLPSTAEPPPGASCMMGMAAAQQAAPSSAATAPRTSSLHLELPLCCIDITATDTRTAIAVAKNKPLMIAQRPRLSFPPARNAPQPLKMNSTQDVSLNEGVATGDAATSARPLDVHAPASPLRARRRRTASEKDNRAASTNQAAVKPARVSRVSNTRGQAIPQRAVRRGNTLAQAEAALVARVSTSSQQTANRHREAICVTEDAPRNTPPPRTHPKLSSHWHPAATSAPPATGPTTTRTATYPVPWFEPDALQAPSLSKPISGINLPCWSKTPNQPSLADFVEAPLERRRIMHACAPLAGSAAPSTTMHASEHQPAMDTHPGVAMHAVLDASFGDGDRLWDSRMDVGTAGCGAKASPTHGAGIATVAPPADAGRVTSAAAAAAAASSVLLPGQGSVTNEPQQGIAPAAMPSAASVAWMHAAPSQQARCPTVSGLSRRRAESARAKVDRWLLGTAGQSAPRRTPSPARQQESPHADSNAIARAEAEPQVVLGTKTIGQRVADVDIGQDELVRGVCAPGHSAATVRLSSHRGDASVDEFGPGVLAAASELPAHDLSKYATPLPHGLVSRSTPSSGSGAGDTSSTGGDLEPSPLAAARTLRAGETAGEFGRAHVSRKHHKSSQRIWRHMTAAWSDEVKSAAQRRHEPALPSDADHNDVMLDEAQE